METSDPTVNPEEAAATAAPENAEALAAEAASWDESAAQGEAAYGETAAEEYAYPPQPPGPPLKVYDQCLMESVGIEANGDFFLTMVHAGAPLGTFGGMFLSTSDDNQSEITLKVCAGTN